MLTYYLEELKHNKGQMVNKLWSFFLYKQVTLATAYMKHSYFKF